MPKVLTSLRQPEERALITLSLSGGFDPAQRETCSAACFCGCKALLQVVLLEKPKVCVDFAFEIVICLLGGN
jgi:hypothetical protein